MADGLDILLAGGEGQPNGLDVLMGAQAQPAAKPEPTYGGPPLTRVDRFMKGLNDVSAAGAQLLTHALPDKAVRAVNDATSYVNELPVVGPLTQMLGMVPATAKSLDADIAQGEQQYQAARRQGAMGLSNLVTGKPADPGIDWMRMGGNMLGTAALPVPAATGRAAMAALKAATGGAAVSVLNPVTEDAGDFWTQKAKQAALGAGVGAAGNALLRGVASAVSPTVRPEVKTLLDEGVSLTPGQIMGGGVKRAEDAMTSIPVLGDIVKNAQRRSFASLNDAALNRALSPIGDKLPSGFAGRKAVEYADNAIGEAYNSTLAKIGAIHPDQPFAEGVANLAGMMQNIPKDKAQQFVGIVKNEIGSRLDNGSMTAEGFKAADSNIGQMARGYLRSQDYDTAQLGAALLQLQTEMRSMLGRVAPPALSKDLSAANAAFANFLRPQRASASLGAEGGIFTPEQLQNAVKALDSSKRKGAFTTGNALMQDLSESAKTVMGNKVPDSGTPFRHAVGAGVAGLLGHSMLPESMAGAAFPAAAGLGLLSLPYTQLGSRAATGLLTRRPEGAEQLANGIRQLAPYGAYVSIPVAGAQR
jgi:uncharacterized protein YjbJ (UPF0337 family)